MGKGGKREGDNELKLRRSWGYQSSRYTEAIQPNTQLETVSVSFVNAAVHLLVPGPQAVQLTRSR